MIETVPREKFYKDVCHDSLHPAVPNDPRALLVVVVPPPLLLPILAS
jgi:hypothetical protein